MSSADDAQLTALLRLKRYESPDAAAWEAFDRKLSSKLLKAAVREPVCQNEKWNQLARSAWRQLTQAMPLTAAAALVVTVYLGSGSSFSPTEYESAAQVFFPKLEHPPLTGSQPLDSAFPDALEPRFVVSTLEATALEGFGAEASIVPVSHRMTPLVRGRVEFVSPVIEQRPSGALVGERTAY
jgi:hypothetical protein